MNNNDIELAKALLLDGLDTNYFIADAMIFNAKMEMNQGYNILRLDAKTYLPGFINLIETKNILLTIKNDSDFTPLSGIISNMEFAFNNYFKVDNYGSFNNNQAVDLQILFYDFTAYHYNILINSMKDLMRSDVSICFGIKQKHI
jgi:hypothetical protein